MIILKESTGGVRRGQRSGPGLKRPWGTAPRKYIFDGHGAKSWKSDALAAEADVQGRGDPARGASCRWRSTSASRECFGNSLSPASMYMSRSLWIRGSSRAESVCPESRPGSLSAVPKRKHPERAKSRARRGMRGAGMRGLPCLGGAPRAAHRCREPGYRENEGMKIHRSICGPREDVLRQAPDGRGLAASPISGRMEKGPDPCGPGPLIVCDARGLRSRSCRRRNRRCRSRSRRRLRRGCPARRLRRRRPGRRRRHPRRAWR